MKNLKFTHHFSSWTSGLKSGFSAAGLVPLFFFGIFMLFQVSASAQITAAIIDKQDVSCFGGNDGYLTAQGFGGWAPYTYVWSDGQTGPTASNLAAGQYSVTVTDMDLAFTVVIATIFEPAELGIFLQASGSCSGSGGSVTSTVFQGTPPYSYLWSTGDATANISGLAPGTYTLTVTDSNGCTASESATVTSSGNLNLFTTASFETCAGSADATATVVVQSGGVPPYTYLWSDGQTTDIAVGLSAGTYSVTVTDANGCTGEATQIVELSPEGVWIMVTTTDADCLQNNGTAHAGPMTGTPPYTYIWNTGETTQDITGLAPGTYTVTVTDANGCSNSDSGVVGQTGAPSAGFILTTDPTDFCVDDGIDDIVTVTASGNTGSNFTFVVTDSNGNILNITTNNVFNFEGAGVGVCRIYGLAYEGTITGLSMGENINDLQGCYALSQPISVNRNSCTNNCTVDITPKGASICPDGSIQFTATTTGTTGPVSYTWTATGGSFDDASSATPIWSMMTPGTYTISVAITDSVGCMSSAMTSATVNPNPTVDITPDGAEICLGSSVDFSTNASGAGPLTYVWTATGGMFDDASSATPTWTSATPGTYTISVNVTDANGCMAADQTTVTVNPNPTVDITPDGAEICSGGSVTFDANVTGNGPFTYNWTASGGSFDDATSAMPTWTMMVPGTYTISVTVTDDNGCTASDQTTVTVNPAPSVDITPDNAEICPGGSVTFDANATGNGPFTYSWTATGGTFDDATSAMPTWTMMVPGTYTIGVTVTDDNGCTASDQTTVTVNPSPEVTINPQGAEICVDQNLQLTANVTGNGPFTYNWTATGGTFDDATSATPLFMTMVAGTFTISVTVTDANGCSGSDQTTVNVVEPDAGTLTIDDSLACLLNGVATISATHNGDTIVPSGFQVIYVLTQGPGLVIIDTNSSPTFDVTALGKYTIHTLVYNPATLDLSVIVPGVTTAAEVIALLVQGGGNICASLDADGAMVEVFMRKIGDYVWLDGNQNGYQDAFENGFPGAIVSLLMAGPDGLYCTPDDIVVDRDTTAADGLYCFECVRPGKYAVHFDINNPLYVFTTMDAGLDDTKDSDADSLTGKTVEIMIMPTDGDNLTIDAGVHLKCDNLTVGGSIAANQNICQGQTPALLVSTQLPSGGYGNIEYLWMYSTTPGAFDPLTWIPLPNSNSPNFQPGALFETTFFARCARRECCDDYVESNIIRIQVDECIANGMGNLSASVINNGNAVALEWAVGFENDVYNYFVERSSDAANFELVGKVAGSGSTDRDNAYEYTDANPTKGKVFYRVKRVGLSNGTEYSNVVEVLIGIKGMKDIYVYPNPVYGDVTVRPLHEMSTDGLLTVVNLNGRVVYSQKLTSNQKQMTLNLDDLVSGVYYIRIQENGSDEISIVRILKVQ